MLFLILKPLGLGIGPIFDLSQCFPTFVESETIFHNRNESYKQCLTFDLVRHAREGIFKYNKKLTLSFAIISKLDIKSVLFVYQESVLRVLI